MPRRMNLSTLMRVVKTLTRSWGSTDAGTLATEVQRRMTKACRVTRTPRVAMTLTSADRWAKGRMMNCCTSAPTPAEAAVPTVNATQNGCGGIFHAKKMPFVASQAM